MFLDKETEKRWKQSLSTATPKEILHELSVDSDSFVRDAVARNANTAEETLQAMYNEGNNLHSIAANPNASLELLEILSVSDDESIRQAVAINTKTHLDLLHKMSQDVSVFVLELIAVHPNTTEELRNRLIEEHNKK